MEGKVSLVLWGMAALTCNVASSMVSARSWRFANCSCACFSTLIFFRAWKIAARVSCTFVSTSWRWPCTLSTLAQQPMNVNAILNTKFVEWAACAFATRWQHVQMTHIENLIFITSSDGYLICACTKQHTHSDSQGRPFQAVQRSEVHTFCFNLNLA